MKGMFFGMMVITPLALLVPLLKKQLSPHVFLISASSVAVM
jgi:hypothetical protein